MLLPVYYGERLTSIYHYLGGRFGPWTQRTGAAFFLLSRTVGAAARLYLAAGVLQLFVFGAWGVPFAATVALILALILTYTFKGGIKTLVWTDLFQSGCLLLGVLLSIAALLHALGLGVGQLWRTLEASPYSQVFFWSDWRSEQFFWKQFVGGALIALTMTGLDQNMMQKNLSCRTLGGAQKNLLWFSLVAVVVNGMFLALGGLLYHFAAVNGVPVPERSDQLFPLIALQHLGAFAAVVFVIGLTAATFNSADSVLTTLTTSFYFDILGHDERRAQDDAASTRTRHRIHIGFAVVLLLAILVFQWVSSGAVITLLLAMANYTLRAAARPLCVRHPHAAARAGWRRAGRVPDGAAAVLGSGHECCGVVRRLSVQQRAAGGERGDYCAGPRSYPAQRGSGLRIGPGLKPLYAGIGGRRPPPIH